MPRDVPLDADGFEDASAFFKSPAGTEARVTNRSIGTVFRSRFTNTAGGKSGGVVDTPAPPPKRGRLSALAGGSDDEDGSNLGEGLLLEDDDVLAGGKSNVSLSIGTSRDGGTPRTYRVIQRWVKCRIADDCQNYPVLDRTLQTMVSHLTARRFVLTCAVRSSIGHSA